MRRVVRDIVPDAVVPFRLAGGNATWTPREPVLTVATSNALLQGERCLVPSPEGRRRREAFRAEASRQPVTSYVRHRLVELRDSGEIDVTLAMRGGLSTSFLRQVRRGEVCVGSTSMPRLARMLGFTPLELVAVAGAWWAARCAEGTAA